MDSETLTVRDLLTLTLDGEWGLEPDAPHPYETIHMRIIRGTDFDAVQTGAINSVPVRAVRSDIAQRKGLQEGDVLIETAGGSAKRSTGRVCFVSRSVIKNADRPITCASFARFLRFDKAKIDPEFAYWSLQNLHSTGVMAQHQVQHTGIARFQFTKFAEAQSLYVPALQQQRATVSLLRTLQERILSLTIQNATLEAIARAIFKSWFVDFDPVRTRAEGRDPEGMDAGTAALFPDSFGVSEHVQLPDGWRATKLGAEAERHGGRIQTGPFGSQLHASDYMVEGIPVVMPQDLSNRRVSTTRVARIKESDAVRLSRHRLEVGDIIYSRRGDVERHAQISTREAGWLCGTGCLLVRMGPLWPSPAFISLALDRPEARAWINQHAIGATLPNLNTGILSDVPLIVPSETLLRAFTALIEPMEQLISENNARSQTLSMLRDTLLPRLISGKLRAPEAEKMVEAVL